MKIRFRRRGAARDPGRPQQSATAPSPHFPVRGAAGELADPAVVRAWLGCVSVVAERRTEEDDVVRKRWAGLGRDIGRAAAIKWKR